MQSHTIEEIVELEKQEYEFLDTLDIKAIYKNCHDDDCYYLQPFASYIEDKYREDYHKWQKENNKKYDSEIFNVIGNDYEFADYLNQRYGRYTANEVLEPIFTLNIE